MTFDHAGYALPAGAEQGFIDLGQRDELPARGRLRSLARTTRGRTNRRADPHDGSRTSIPGECDALNRDRFVLAPVIIPGAPLGGVATVDRGVE